MLNDKAATLGANFAQFQGVEGVAEYAAGAKAEYYAAKSSVALMDRSFTGRVELAGADRFDFLNRMSTNDTQNLKVGDGLQTVLTTPEAKIIDLLTIYVQSQSMLCLTSPQNRVKVLNWFKRNIFFRDKVKPSDVSDSTTQLSLFGPGAAGVLKRVTEQDSPPLLAYHSSTFSIAGTDVLVARVPSIAGGGYDVMCAGDHGERLWDVLMEAGLPLGMKPMGTTAFNWLRLEAAQPLYGFELSEEYNPLEANLNHTISFSKGCYTGQEVIARLDTYQKLKQRLVGLRLSSVPQAQLPLLLQMDGVEVGRLTSAAQLPDQADVIGLGYVRIKYLQPGARVEIVAEHETITGTLFELSSANAVQVVA